MECLGNKYLPFDAEELDGSSMWEIRKQIGESEESRTRCLQILRKDLQSLKDIHPCLEEDFLLQVLRIAKFDPTKALQKILRFYQHQDKLAEVFSKFSMSLQKAGSLNHMWVSPYRLENNSLLVIALAGKVDYSVYSFEERLYLDVITIYYCLKNPLNVMCGIHFILDFSGFNRRAFFEFTPRRMKLFAESLADFPLRIKGYHIINHPSVFSVIIKMAYPFLPKKIRDRFFAHPNDNWKSLHSHVPPDILPEQYGGKLKQSSLINPFENIPELDEHYRQQMQFGSLRNRHLRQTMRAISR
ncbi:alpha-tocopherol transfer protein-like [Caerostris darwini]|uniref:Alpha-tocopherol transfer protein-like n=1 Tax=Caerostris darwini TaxID=1538125 RepID=A0AAV4R318_9ARAC|nr:alpha-tocopherol transfer protein-like [Caerostris darwini]